MYNTMFSDRSSESNNILPVKPIRTKEPVRGKPVMDFTKPRPGKGEGDRPVCDKGAFSGDCFRK